MTPSTPPAFCVCGHDLAAHDHTGACRATAPDRRCSCAGVRPAARCDASDDQQLDPFEIAALLTVLACVLAAFAWRNPHPLVVAIGVAITRATVFTRPRRPRSLHGRAR